MRHPATKTVYRQWQRLKGNSGAPDRRAINPADFGVHLADVFLLDRTNGETRFRLAGSRVCSLFGEELRNVAFTRLFTHAAHDDANDMLTAVIEDQTPVISGIAALFPDRLSADGEMLLLPLSFSDGAAGESRLLGVLTTSGHRPSAQPACTALEILSLRMLNDDDVPLLVAGSDAPQISVPPEHAAMRRARFRVYTGGLG